jgi:hypothetical protein
MPPALKNEKRFVQTTRFAGSHKESGKPSGITNGLGVGDEAEGRGAKDEERQAGGGPVNRLVSSDSGSL